MTSESNLEKLQRLLRQIFQFDCADLDFGIYRILNHKRERIEEFFTTELPKTVASALERGALADQAEAVREAQALRKQISEAMGEEAVDGDGILAAAYHNTPLGRKYLQARDRATGASSRAALEAAVYNHLATFFSRYYDNGDFMSKRRYSKREKYAIPYNGEEVYLHWANSDQYYIKTGEHFTDYAFQSQGVTVHFRLQNAEVEQDNVKGDKRFFIPLVKQATFDAKTKQAVIPFEFRPLREQEDISYGKKNQQEAIIAQAVEAIPKHLEKDNAVATALLAERRRTGEGEPVSNLEYHLSQYTRRNTSDFFIHKDLRGFLERELDFYLKNEVLNLDDLAAAGEGRAEGWFQLMRVIRSIGGRIIAFLAQIENFQKKLFEKRKFVTETHYCITLGSIPEGFHEDIAANEAQWEEWRELFHIDENERNLFTANAKSKKDRRVAFLKSHPTLALDTRHFDEDFVATLLASFDHLDDNVDGLLVHGENLQALNLLLGKYQGQVKSIYIDPPYNTDAGPILYKNDYRNSCWMTLMADRIRLSRDLLKESGVLCVTIDDYQQKELHFLLEQQYGPQNLAGTVVIRSNPSGRPVPSGFAQAHEYALFVTKSPGAPISTLPRTEEQAARYRHEDEQGSFMWELFRKRGSNSERKDRPSLYYPIYVCGETVRVPQMEWDERRRTWKVLEEPRSNEKAVYPLDDSGTERTWRGQLASISRNPGNYRAKSEGEEVTVYYKFRPNSEGVLALTMWMDAKYSATEHGTGFLKHYFTQYNVFSYPKSIYAVEDSLRICGLVEDPGIACDFFAGSGTTGHAVINLNRKDGLRRFFLLVEMEGYFGTVLLPRIKKATFSPQWREGKPVRMSTKEEAERSPRIVKYIRIESYEDALKNIRFTLPKGQTRLEFDDYLLEYMLDWETAESETFLNVEKLASPFDYKMVLMGGQETREKPVDLPETFNFLLGLHVKTRRAYNDKGRRYVVYRGTVDHREVAVIWRATKDWTKKDFERDKEFVEEQKLAEAADEVFVNGDSFIPGARSLDPVFKHRMFAGV